LATISGTTVNWSPVRVDGYGPVLGYQSPTLTANTLLADTLVWRSRGIDPSCFYNLGARYCDPVSGHFLSPEPLGHAGSMDLHSFCNGDPANYFDPTGRFGKGDFGQEINDLENAGEDLRNVGNAAFHDAQGFEAGVSDFFTGSHYGAALNSQSYGFYGFGQGSSQAVAELAEHTAVIVLQVGLAVATDGIGEAGLLADEGTAVEEGAALEESEIGEANASKLANTFDESGQGEFGFVKQVEEEQAASAVETGGTKLSNTFNEAGQGEFGFLGQVKSKAAGTAGAEQLELPFGGAEGASEAQGGALQGEQLELDFNGVGNGVNTGSEGFWIGEGLPNGGTAGEGPGAALRGGQDFPLDTRSQALQDAKAANSVSRSAQPLVIKPGTPEGNVVGLRPDQNVRLYQYINNDAEPIWIREDMPVTYPDGGMQGPHFNSGPAGGNLINHHYWIE
jgi:RHS repeat-associated protein